MNDNVPEVDNECYQALSSPCFWGESLGPRLGKYQTVPTAMSLRTYPPYACTVARPTREGCALLYSEVIPGHNRAHHPVGQRQGRSLDMYSWVSLFLSTHTIVPVVIWFSWYESVVTAHTILSWTKDLSVCSTICHVPSCVFVALYFHMVRFSVQSISLTCSQHQH